MTKCTLFFPSVVRFALVAILLAGCGRIVIMPVSEEVKLGAGVAKQVEEQIGIYHAPETTAYIEAIGNRLVSNLDKNPFEFSFQIVDQPEPNAFAIPGGHVYVSRGLLILANSEDELAGVIGHEITHVTRRHSMKQMQKGILPGLLTLPGRVVGRVIDEDLGNLLNSPVNAVGQVYLASYGRGQESEADQLGMRLSAKSGYDPKELATILGQLVSDVEMLTGEKRKFSFFDSHPTTPKRTKEIHRDAEKIEWSRKPGISKNQHEMQRRLEGLIVGHNPAQGVFRERQYLQPDLNFTITFPEGWKTVNTPQSVGAIAPKEEGMVFLGIAGPAADPKAQAQAFMDQLKKEFGAEPFNTREVEIGNWPGHVLIYEDPSGKEPMYIHFLWVAADKLTYQLIGVGPERLKPSLRETALSLRPLTGEERDSFTGLRLRLATAMAGESLADLSQRTGNQWALAYTAMVNHIPEDKTLSAGDVIKIAKEEPYRGK